MASHPNHQRRHGSSTLPLDVDGLVSRFGIAAQIWMFGEITRAVKKAKVDPETPGVTVSQVIAIHRLLESEAPFEDADAREAHLWMTNAFPELMDTGTLTLENLLKYAADLRGRGMHGTCLHYDNLRKDLGDYLLEHALYPEDESIDSNPGGTQAERREWLRQFLDEEDESKWPSIRNEPKDHRAWLRNHLALVDFMVDMHGNLPMVVMQRYGAAVYDANMDQLRGNIEPAKQLIIEAVEYAVREIVAECDGVVARMEPYMEVLKAAIKDLMKY